MSGGSYDFLYCKDTEEMFSKSNDIDDMAETLEKLNYLDVARDMRRLSEYIKSACNRVEVLSKQLKPIMKAVEYYEDCDISAESLGKEVEKYRKGGCDMREPNCVRCDHFGDCDGCERSGEE